MSSIGISRRRGFVMSACANTGHHHLVFERQQSLDLRQLEWEGRLKPMLSWGALALRGGVTLLLAGAMLAMMISGL